MRKSGSCYSKLLHQVWTCTPIIKFYSRHYSVTGCISESSLRITAASPTSTYLHPVNSVGTASTTIADEALWSECDRVSNRSHGGDRYCSNDFVIGFRDRFNSMVGSHRSPSIWRNTGCALLHCIASIGDSILRT